MNIVCLMIFSFHNFAHSSYKKTSTTHTFSESLYRALYLYDFFFATGVNSVINNITNMAVL